MDTEAAVVQKDETHSTMTRPTTPKLDQHGRHSSVGSDTTLAQTNSIGSDTTLVPTNSLDSVIALVPTNSAPAPLVGPRKLGDCEKTCRCKCHVRTAHKWPQLLQRSGANDVAGSISRPSFIYRCSDANCKARQGLRTGTVYITPSWLRRKAVTISILLRGFKIERHLRSQNIVAENSDVIRYTIKGDIDGLRRLFSQRAASIHDTTLDGWSLLHVGSPLLLLLFSRSIDGSSVQRTMADQR